MTHFRVFESIGLFGDFCVFAFFEFGGVSESLVNDFAFTACHFWTDVFDYKFAVMLSAAHWSC